MYLISKHKEEEDYVVNFICANKVEILCVITSICHSISIHLTIFLSIYPSIQPTNKNIDRLVELLRKYRKTNSSSKNTHTCPNLMVKVLSTAFIHFKFKRCDEKVLLFIWCWFWLSSLYSSAVNIFYLLKHTISIYRSIYICF